MPSETIYALEASNVSISGGGQLSGVTQGDGGHLAGLTITLDTNDWVAINILDTEANFDDSDNSQTLDGVQDFDGVTYASGIRVEAEYRVVVETPDGVEYTLIGFNLNATGDNPSYGTVEGLAFVDTGLGFPPVGVALTVTGTFEGPSVPYADLAVPPCFTPGTRIATPFGLADIADLNAGDKILTMDSGLQTIRWIGRTNLPSAVLKTHPKYLPVLIEKDALGPGLPFQDMHVSPQHRVLVSGWQAELLFGAVEILVPAIKLCNGASIRQELPEDGVTYIHMLFDAHEVVWSDGIPTESYLPAEGDTSDMAHEVTTLFPALDQAQGQMVAARPCISDRRAVVLSL